MTHSINELVRVILERVQVLDVWRLETLDIHEVRPHDLDAIDVEPHPDPVAERGEHHLQVDVVAEDEPEAEHGLAQTEDEPEAEPGDHEAADILGDAPDEEDGGEDEEHEHDDAEPARVLRVRVEVSLKQGEIELGSVSSIQKI